MSMNFNDYSGLETRNIADFGAQRVLGINGSLTSYINTGNAFGDEYETTKHIHQ